MQNALQLLYVEWHFLDGQPQTGLLHCLNDLVVHRIRLEHFVSWEDLGAVGPSFLHDVGVSEDDVGGFLHAHGLDVVIVRLA